MTNDELERVSKRLHALARRLIGTAAGTQPDLTDVERTDAAKMSRDIHVVLYELGKYRAKYGVC